MNGSKKNSSSSSSSTSTLSSLSQVFHMPSWFSKFKQMSHKNKSPHARNTKPHSPLPLNLNHDVVVDVNDDHSYWQLSFGGGTPQGKGVVGSDSNYDLKLSLSSGKSCREGTREKEVDGNFDNIVCNVRREDTNVIPPRGKIKNKKAIEMDRKGYELKVERRNQLDLDLLETFQKLEKEYQCFKDAKKPQFHFSPSKQRRTRKEDQESLQKLQVVEEEDTQEGGSEKNVLKELKTKKKSVRRRAKQSCRVKVHSPRTPPSTSKVVEVCKIRALEDYKTKKKKKGKDLEEFAVVKCSYDPQKDFRESMVEMIEENDIKGGEEMEKLLACYLSLNSDEFHHLIVKAFRQVWLDMNQLPR